MGTGDVLVGAPLFKDVAVLPIIEIGSETLLILGTVIGSFFNGPALREGIELLKMLEVTLLSLLLLLKMKALFTIFFAPRLLFWDVSCNDFEDNSAVIDVAFKGGEKLSFLVFGSFKKDTLFGTSETILLITFNLPFIILGIPFGLRAKVLFAIFNISSVLFICAEIIEKQRVTFGLRHGWVVV